jgi:DNA-binding beta-propeller fold protein YncE
VSRLDLIAVSLLLLGCADSPTQSFDEDLPADRVSVQTTLAFGDPTLEGRLVLTPAPEAGEVTYEVDLDGDGRIDEAGVLRLGVSLPYRFDEPGVYTLTVTLTEGSAGRVERRRVIVNDRIRAGGLARRIVPSPVEDESHFSTVEGIAISPDGGTLFTSDWHEGHLRAFDIDSGQEIWRIDLFGERENENSVGPSQAGLAVSPDGSNLYLDLGESLGRIDLRPGATLAIDTLLVSTEHYTSIRVDPGGTVFLGGWGGVARLDPAAEAVAAAYETTDGLGFALSTTGDAVAFTSHTDPEIRVLDAATLGVAWTLDVPGSGNFPVAAAFSPSGHRLYVLVLVGSSWRLWVIDPVQRRLLADEMIHRSDGNVGYPWAVGAGRPTATTRDGRYVVFSTLEGAFFVDTVLDLPRYRTPELPTGEPLGCCNVVAAPGGDRLYFANREVDEILVLEPDL